MIFGDWLRSRFSGLKRLSGYEDMLQEMANRRQNQDTGSHAVEPLFQDEWEAEYIEASFQPQTARAVCSIGAIYFLFNYLYSTFGDSSDGTGGDFVWVSFTLFPHLLCSLVYCVTALLLSLRQFRPFCVRNFDSICACKINFTYMAVVAPRVMLEIRRAFFQRSTYPQVHWGIKFQMLPVRVCNDSDPVRSYTMMSSGDDDTTSIGCENTILGGGMLSSYIFLNLISVVYRMRPRAAIQVSLVNTFVVIAALLATGTKGSTLLSFVAFQMVAGMSSAYFCRNHQRIARRQFAIIKATKFASEQNGNLLYTLIPKNVVMKLASHEGKGMLGTSIERCTVMFCSLEPHSQLRVMSEEVFELLNEVFSEFDQAVKRYGMFKYQHVSEWYIVACPRAANPFDEEEQGKPYPMQYTMSMIFLAQELCTIAKRYSVGDTKLWLKVGINCGPVAGAVIGCHRSFYCLYGDTINTSARMCKIADGKVHCTAVFHELVKGTCSALIDSESRGTREIKGKGAMEVFDISVNQQYYTVARAFRGSDAEDGGGAGADGRLLWKQRTWISTTLFAPFVERIMGNLSQEAYAWINDPRHRIDHRWLEFKDSAYEALYVKAQALSTRQGLLAGLAVHLCSFACQWNLAIHPEYHYDFKALGSTQLAQASRVVTMTLSIHWGVLSAYCVGLLGIMWIYPQLSMLCNKHYVMIKLLHMAISVVSFTELPALWGLMLSFSFEMICLHGAMATLSFRLTLALVGASFIAFAVALSDVHGAAPYTVCKACAIAVAAVCLARIANYNQRFRWRLHNLLEAELRLVREKLFDLLPARIARTMIEVSNRVPSEGGEAAVLQLDICGFTSMSQEMSPMAVAEMVHHLFSIFDRAVQASGLFKMDTVGDAYLVAALLNPFPDPDDPDDEDSDYDAALELILEDRARMCEEVLRVARTMIEAVEGYRAETGREVRCRIGVSVGPVLTGVLGVLQPRFHMFGPGMRSAEALEQKGAAGAVHVSAAFARALRGAGAVRPSWPWKSTWWPSAAPKPPPRLSSASAGSANSAGAGAGAVVTVKKTGSGISAAAGVGGGKAVIADAGGGWWIEEPELVMASPDGKTTTAVLSPTRHHGLSTKRADSPPTSPRSPTAAGGGVGGGGGGGGGGVGRTASNSSARLPSTGSARLPSSGTGNDSDTEGWGFGFGVGSFYARSNSNRGDGKRGGEHSDEVLWGRRGWTILWTNNHIGCACTRPCHPVGAAAAGGPTAGFPPAPASVKEEEITADEATDDATSTVTDDTGAATDDTVPAGGASPSSTVRFAEGTSPAGGGRAGAGAGRRGSTAVKGGEWWWSSLAGGGRRASGGVGSTPAAGSRRRSGGSGLVGWSRRLSGFSGGTGAARRRQSSMAAAAGPRRWSALAPGSRRISTASGNSAGAPRPLGTWSEDEEDCRSWVLLPTPWAAPGASPSP